MMVNVGHPMWHQKKGACPNCDKDITLDEIKKICVDKRNNCLVEDETMIRAALPYLNIYRKKVGINTCIRKAHFLAQISQESKFYSLQENLNWYWEKLIGKFSSYFNQFRTRLEKETEAKRLGRINGSPTPGLTLNQQIKLANAIYGHTHTLGRLHVNTGDGWLYSGKGFKQITWKENYQNLEKYLNTHMKVDNEPDVDWTDGDNPYKLKNNPKDAITSALAYWGKNNINSLSNENNAKAVEKVSLKINAIADGLKERQRFFKKANDILKLSDCKAGTLSNLDIGTVVVVSGEGSKKIQDWVVYKTNIYLNMSLDTYKKQKTENKLPVEDYSIFLSRDAHGDKTKYGKHSNKRYGKNNETPPGEYYLIPKSDGQKYKIYLSDDGKSASINGPHGIRAGIAIHQYSPKYSIGCLTTVTGQDTKLVEELLSKLEDLPLNDDRPVRIILEQRSVKEEKWDNTEIGDTKWTGIL